MAVGDFVVAWWEVLIALLIIFILFVILIKRLWDDKKLCPERNLFVKARKKGLSIIEIVDIGSNTAIWELGEKKRNDDIEFTSNTTGTRVDPMLVQTGCEPKSVNGLKFYSYAYESWLPQTIRNTLAYKAIEIFKNESCQDLDFLTIQEFVSLLSTPENHLEHDVGMYITKYFKNAIATNDDGSKRQINVRQFTKEIVDGTSGQPIIKMMEQEITIPEVIQRIETIKNEVTRLPIYRGYFSNTEAFRNNAYAYSAQTLEALLTLRDRMNFEEFMRKFNIMLYAVAIVAILIGGAVALYVIAGGLKDMTVPTQLYERRRINEEIENAYISSSQAAANCATALAMGKGNYQNLYRDFFQFFYHLFDLTKDNKELNEKESKLSESIESWLEGQKNLVSKPETEITKLVGEGLVYYSKYKKALSSSGIITMPSSKR